MPTPARPATWRMKSAMSGRGSGLMSWRTISASASEGVLTMSRKSFGTHCRLAPPMITIRGAIRPPHSELVPDTNVSETTTAPSDGVFRPHRRAQLHYQMEGFASPWSGLELREPLGGGGEHLVGHGHDVVVGEL